MKFQCNSSSKGKYEKVLSDYKKLTELLQGTSVPVFQRLMNEVQKTIEQFKEKLFKELEGNIKTVEDIKRLIR